jgi:uncharacterized protein YceH (UPF0502 family)
MVPRDKMRLARPLSPIEIRVLGSLLEKQQTTPDNYPMTINAIINACNQKSNREPVMELSEQEVSDALDNLQHQVLVWKVMGARTVHWKHNLDTPWQLEPAQKALLTVLFLRGPQTPGELRGRTERMHPFASIPEVEQSLAALAAGDEPLVAELPRQPGQKERRWAHLASGPLSAEDLARVPERAEEARTPLSERVAQLETEVAELREELRSLRAQLGD